jgi:hypothetical protein
VHPEDVGSLVGPLSISKNRPEKHVLASLANKRLLVAASRRFCRPPLSATKIIHFSCIKI